MTTTTPARATRRATALGIGLRRGVLELKQFLRQKDTVIFTFSFPLLMTVLFGAIFQRKLPGTDVDFTQYFLAGMVATGVMGTTFVLLAVGIALERDDGTLKRLRAMPMPLSAYFIGKTVLVLVASIAQTVLLLVFGSLFFGLTMPATAGKWLTLGWVLLLGVIACTLLGVAMSAVPRSGRSAAAVVMPIFVVLQFISGVFFVFTELPGPVQAVGGLFPLKWLSQGLRSVFLPEELQRMEPAGSWDHPGIAIVLALWIVAGLVLSVATFRWQRARS
ncbi:MULTISPECIES: ABC transporter permease [unclassified Crossiella]|uniref:ABC transporter permease n=1 Tax=unclassified Crossiella TaxID=2620835 RepID=UPI0020001336|nr:MULTISPECIES: ABC transporter permease [unclassified Crossiella]MCK2243123.1 ABC transporter permease [Crossiella sp. S99.2]MCK2257000.1 ABC transporter permease [Crossiella sp. S99.1]